MDFENCDGSCNKRVSQFWLSPNWEERIVFPFKFFLINWDTKPRRPNDLPSSPPAVTTATENVCGEILILVSPQRLVTVLQRRQNKSWSTSSEQDVDGGSWTLKWQTEGINEAVVPEGRRGNSAPLIMRWPSPRKWLLQLPSETFSYVSRWDAPHQRPFPGSIWAHV